MSQSTDAQEENTYVGFDLDSARDKRKLKMRVSQKGYKHMSDYVKDLVYEDLDEADELDALLE